MILEVAVTTVVIRVVIRSFVLGIEDVMGNNDTDMISSSSNVDIFVNNSVSFSIVNTHHTITSTFYVQLDCYTYSLSVTIINVTGCYYLSVGCQYLSVTEYLYTSIDFIINYDHKTFITHDNIS